MNTHQYPFAAIVGQPDLKLALLLAGVDSRLSVLLKGDKGSGKSTAARALADILPAGVPFVNLPIGTTEDRLLGGLDLAEALGGQARLKRGLIHEAHGGVLYIDEVNLLADALTDALLDVATTGYYYVERDGFSASNEAKFVLLGSMNIEEGSLRPQLLDRFALSLDIETPRSAEDRAQIVEARLRFDADPAAFCAEYATEQERFRQAIATARSLLSSVKAYKEILREISKAIAEAGVRSLRADLAALRAALAHAALDGRELVTHEDADAVLPLVLGHRSKRQPLPPPPPSKPAPEDSPRESEGRPMESNDRIFPSEPRQAPELRIKLADSIARGLTATVKDRATAETVRSGSTAKGESLDVVSSFTRSFRNTGAVALRKDHLVFRPAHMRSGVRFVFVVDASGSQAAQQRMRAVKGVALALLQSSVDHKDEIAVIAFRGSKAEVVLEPCRDADAASRALEYLPTGGRTPLAHALDLAGSVVNSNSVLILLTDGRANVPLTSNDPWADALAAAGKLACTALIVDSSADDTRRKAMEDIASAMKAKLIGLDEFSNESVMSALES